MSRKNEIVAEEVSERKALWAPVRRAEPIQQVRRLMRQNELQNRDLAIRLGISEAGVSRLLNGCQNIQIDTLYSLADALDVSLSINFSNEEQIVTYTYEGENVSNYFSTGSDVGAESSNVVQLESFRRDVAPLSRHSTLVMNASQFELECA